MRGPYARRLTARDVTQRNRRRADLRETFDLLLYGAIRVALVALLLTLAGLTLYEAVAHGRWLWAGALSALASLLQVRR